MSRRLVLGFGLALFGLLFVAKMLPWLRAERTLIASTPTVRPFFQEGQIRVAGGSAICLDGLTLDAGAQAAQFQVRTTAERPIPALRLEVSADGGYFSKGALPAGAPDGSAVTIPFARASDRERAGGELCVRNTGRHRIAFVSAAEGRSQSPSTTRVDGTPVDGDMALTLLAREPGSILENLGDVLDHVDAWRPFPIGTATLWLLAGLLVLGTPVGVAWAMARAVGHDERR